MCVMVATTRLRQVAVAGVYPLQGWGPPTGGTLSLTTDTSSRPHRQATTMTEVMDPAEAVLARWRGFPEPKTYAELSKLTNVPNSTLWHHEQGRLSKKDAAAKKQYLSPSEEKILVDHILRAAERGYPVPVKLLRHLARTIARQRSSTFQIPADDDRIRLPEKNWLQKFYQRHPELKSRKFKALEWAGTIFVKRWHTGSYSWAGSCTSNCSGRKCLQYG